MTADIINIPVGFGQATQAWTRVPNSKDSVLVWNLDVTNFVYVGYNPQVTAGGLNAIPVPPNASFQLPASRNLFVIGKVQGITSLVVIPDALGMFRSLTQGLGALAIPSVFSPGYIPGVTGWSINADGSVEFNNGIFRGTVTAGTFQGTDFVINSDGTFVYNGAPGFGALIETVGIAAPGLDPYGNDYLTGSTTYRQVSAFLWNATQLSGGKVTFLTAVTAAGPYSTVAEISLGTGNQLELLAGDIVASAPVFLSGPLSAGGGTPASPTLITTDTWNDIFAGFPAGWAGRFSYQLMADNTVMVDIDVTIAGAPLVGGGQFINVTLPGPSGSGPGYRPATAKKWEANAKIGGNWTPVSFDVDTGGNVHAMMAGVTTITAITGQGRYAVGPV